MSLFSKAASFARTPQGRRVMDRAQRMARDPETRRELAEARARLTARTRRA
jgi:hypothetical protein